MKARQGRRGRKAATASEDDDSDLDLPEGVPVLDDGEAGEGSGADDDEAVASTSREGQHCNLYCQNESNYLAMLLLPGTEGYVKRVRNAHQATVLSLHTLESAKMMS